MRVVAGRVQGPPPAAAARRADAADRRPRARGALLDPRRRRGRARARPLRRLRRARDRGALARRGRARRSSSSDARAVAAIQREPRRGRRRGGGQPRATRSRLARALTGARSTSCSATRHMIPRPASPQPLAELLPASLATDALIVTESDKRNPLELPCPLDRRADLRRHPDRDPPWPLEERRHGRLPRVLRPGDVRATSTSSAAAANVFDQVVVGVVNQPVRKQKTLFSAEERVRDSSRPRSRNTGQCAGKIL